jgi:hypothetical protein
VAIRTIDPKDTVTIVDPSKMVAMQWEEHDERAPCTLLCEGGRILRLPGEDLEDFRRNAEAVGVDLGWVSGVGDPDET